MNDIYNKYEKIRLEDTGLIKNNTKDIVYNRLFKNGITNLKELFELDDLDMIDYGSKSTITARHGHLRTMGVVKLLRTHYLDEELPYLEILEGKLINHNLILNSNSENNIYNIINVFLSMGFTFNFAISIRDNMHDNNNKKIIDILENVYEDKVKVICNKPEYIKNKKILAIILEWYYKKNSKLEKISNLKELKETALRFKNTKERKQEYMLAKIQLERILSEETDNITKRLSKA